MKLFGQLGGASNSSSQYAGFSAKGLEGVPCFYSWYSAVYGALQRVLGQIEERIALVVGPGVKELHGIIDRRDLAAREVGFFDPYGRREFHQHQTCVLRERCTNAHPGSICDALPDAIENGSAA